MSELPTGWVMTKVGDVGQVSLGRQRAPKYHRGEGMRPYLRVANLAAWISLTRWARVKDILRSLNGGLGISGSAFG